MSGELTAFDEDEEEFHSEFNLGLGAGALDTFKWLIIGHLLYAVGLAIAIYVPIEMGNVWMTPLFALPLLWSERKHKPWAKALAMIVGFTAAHYAGVWIAMRQVVPTDDASLVPGLLGGALGGALAVAICFSFRLTRPGVPIMVLAAFGVVLLAVTGGVGVYMYMTSSSGDGGRGSELLRMLWIYTPWQVVFAYVLAKVLRPAAH